MDPLEIRLQTQAFFSFIEQILGQRDRCVLTRGDSIIMSGSFCSIEVPLLAEDVAIVDHLWPDCLSLCACLVLAIITRKQVIHGGHIDNRIVWVCFYILAFT